MRIKSSADVVGQNFKKICIHGPSGIGKTMLAATAAPYTPLVILTERTGDESLRPDNIERVFGAGRSDILYQVDIVEAYDSDGFEEAVRFAIDSDRHNLIVFDSLSKASRLILKTLKGVFKDGRKAYGEHNDAALDLLEELIAGDKHVAALTHTTRVEDVDSGEVTYVPSFEGKGFTEKSVYDLPFVLYMDRVFDEEGKAHRALRCQTGDSNKRCKDRSGLLREFEPPHLGKLLQKLSGQSPRNGKGPRREKTKQ